MSTPDDNETVHTVYPEQTRFSFREAVTCLIVADGALLLNAPHNEKLTGLSAGQRQALKILNMGSATITALAGGSGDPGVSELVDNLCQRGWLSINVRAGGADLYTITPFGKPSPRLCASVPSRGRLSKFSVLHRDTHGYVLENPLSWCDIRIHNLRLLTALDGAGVSDTSLPTDMVTRFHTDLRWGMFLVPDGSDENHEFSSISWNTADLWFHRRSTLGERTLTWDHFGPTKWAKSRFPQPAARRPTYPGVPIPLTTPDLAAIRAADPSLTAVIEDRVSVRAFDDENPMTIDQLAELLYRTARTRSTRSETDGEELVSRPYPSGGGLYELELYPLVRNVAGLAPAMYHYDSFDHVLRPVAEIDSPAVKQLLKPASATLEGGAEPQVLLIMAARAGRMMWAYEKVAYSSILKHVGVLMQTIYLSATAMGIGACAQGFGHTAAFTAAIGLPELEECNVGSIVVGTPAAHTRDRSSGTP